MGEVSSVEELTAAQTVGSANVEVGMFQPVKQSMPTLFSPTRDPNSALYDEKSVSLGSSPRSATDEAPESPPPILATRLTMVSASHSTYLCVSPFQSKDNWRDFLEDLRNMASRQGIEIIEVLRSSEGEDVHSAWISLANKDDALRIRGYYMSLTFCGSILDVSFVDEAAYSTTACTASESWCCQEISTAPMLASGKRGRSLPPEPPSREGSPRCDWEGDSGKGGYQGRSPRSKQPRLHYDQPSHRPRQEKNRAPSQHYRRSPSPGFNHPSSERHDRSLPHNNTSLQNRRPPPPAHSQEFRSRGRRHDLSPRRYRHSPSPSYDRELRSSGRYGYRSPTSERYDHSPHPCSPGPSRIHDRSLSPRRHLTPPPVHSQGPRTRGRRSPPPRRYYHRSPSPRCYSPPSIRGQHSGLVEHRPLSPYRRGRYQELRSRDNYHDTFPNYPHSRYSPRHWMPPTVPTFYNGLPAATYDPQSMVAFGSYMHMAPAPYQPMPSQHPLPLASRQLSALGLQPPPIISLSPGLSQWQLARQLPQAAKPSMFQRAEVSLHHRIQNAPRPPDTPPPPDAPRLLTSRQNKTRRRKRGKRARVGPTIDAQDEDLSIEGYGHPESDVQRE